MSHSKLYKHGPIQESPELARFLVRCVACGTTGLDPSYNWEDDTWLANRYNAGVKAMMLRHYKVLAVGPGGICATCAASARFANPS